MTIEKLEYKLEVLQKERELKLNVFDSKIKVLEAQIDCLKNEDEVKSGMEEKRNRRKNYKTGKCYECGDVLNENNVTSSQLKLSRPRCKKCISEENAKYR